MIENWKESEYSNIYVGTEEQVSPVLTSVEAAEYLKMHVKTVCRLAKEGRRFTINIRHESTQQETEETLIHEWAHMMDWRPYHPLSGDHGPTWGVWYASVFSSYCGVK